MSLPANLHVLGAFHHSLCCPGFKSNFARTAITAAAVIGSQAMFHALANNSFHVLFVEDTLPHMGIVPSIDIIASLSPQTKTVILTPSVDHGYINVLHSLNCHGIVHHSTIDTVIKQCIHYIYDVGRYTCPFLGQLRNTSPQPQIIPQQSYKQQAGLTDIEASILTLKIAGKTNNQIADTRCVSPETIRSHIKHYNKKLVANNLGHIIEYCNSINREKE